MAKTTTKKKNFWYVLVLTDDGPVFVTGIQYSPHKWATWDKDKQPLELSDTEAKKLATGLMVNFHMAYPVCAPIEITNQPYFYDKGKFNWVWNDKKEA